MREELYGDSKLEDLQEFRYLGEMLLLGAADILLLILYLPVLSADNLCEHYGSRT